MGLESLSPPRSKAAGILWGPAENLLLATGLSIQDTSHTPSCQSRAQLESFFLTWGKHHPALASLQGPSISIMRTWSSPAHSSLNDEAVKRGCLWGKRWVACRGSRRRQRGWGLSGVNQQTGLLCRLRTKPRARGKYVRGIFVIPRGSVQLLPRRSMNQSREGLYLSAGFLLALLTKAPPLRPSSPALA